MRRYFAHDIPKYQLSTSLTNYRLHIVTPINNYRPVRLVDSTPLPEHCMHFLQPPVSSAISPRRKKNALLHLVFYITRKTLGNITHENVSDKQKRQTFQDRHKGHNLSSPETSTTTSSTQSSWSHLVQAHSTHSRPVPIPCLRQMFQNRHNTGSDLLRYQSYP